jgi:hypothetical protein
MTKFAYPKTARVNKRKNSSRTKPLTTREKQKNLLARKNDRELLGLADTRKRKMPGGKRHHLAVATKAINGVLELTDFTGIARRKTTQVITNLLLTQVFRNFLEMETKRS